MSIDCRIKPVNVCDKDLTGPSVYYPGVLYEPGSSVPPAVEADLLQQFKYDHQESTETFDSNEEVDEAARSALILEHTRRIGERCVCVCVVAGAPVYVCARARCRIEER